MQTIRFVLLTSRKRTQAATNIVTASKAFYSSFDCHHGYHDLKWICNRLAYTSPSSSPSLLGSNCEDVIRTTNRKSNLKSTKPLSALHSVAKPTAQPSYDPMSATSLTPRRQRSSQTFPQVPALQSAQKRFLVWHAGLLEEAQAQELDRTIRHKQMQMVELIRHLPCAVQDCGKDGRPGFLGADRSDKWKSASSKTPNAIVTTTSDRGGNADRTNGGPSNAWTQPAVSLVLIETILQKEQEILSLSQEYKNLTGEDYGHLPEPGMDDSSTVRRMI